MARFRAKLSEIEAEAADEASGGDLEAAVRHVYERQSAAAVPQLTGLGQAAVATVVGYVISSGTGLMTFGLKGLPADLADAAVGAAPGAFLGVRQVYRQRKSRAWVTVRNKIIGLNLALASAEPPKPVCPGPSLLGLRPGVRCFGALLEMLAAVFIVARAARGDLSIGPLAGPPHLVGGDPVVGPARQAPPAD